MMRRASMALRCAGKGRKPTILRSSVLEGRAERNLFSRIARENRTFSSNTPDDRTVSIAGEVKKNSILYNG